MMQTAIPVESYLASLCRLENCTFTLNGEEIPVEVIMGPSMALPFLALYVEQAGSRLLDIDFGCKFRVDPRAALGAVAIVPGVSGNIADLMRGLFFSHYATESFGIRSDAIIEVGSMMEMLRENFSDLLISRARDEVAGVAAPQPSASKNNLAATN